jgi:uncharacterized coiled-coil DUF342 family protein
LFDDLVTERDAARSQLEAVTRERDHRQEEVRQLSFAHSLAEEERDAAREELAKLMRPMTSEEAQAAYEAAEPVPFKPGEVDRIVKSVLLRELEALRAESVELEKDKRDLMSGMEALRAERDATTRHMHKMLRLAGRALEGHHVGREWGGTAPEDIQGFLDQAFNVHQDLATARSEAAQLTETLSRETSRAAALRLELDGLREDAKALADRLSELLEVFRHPNFTDRHGDGDAIAAALASPRIAALLSALVSHREEYPKS